MKKYDVLIIGAGMSGLAAGIRLAYYDKKVMICEKHSVAGGLNSYYTRKGIVFDVGLHAMTNYAEKNARMAPLNKLLRQLKIKWEELELSQQQQTEIRFPSARLIFNNSFESLKESIQNQFPDEIDGFIKLTEYIEKYDALALNAQAFISAKETVRHFIKSELLLNIIFCPLMYYGSAWEHDMDFSQFAIMFRSVLLEGFSRPAGGVLRIIRLLEEKYKNCGGELRYNSGVERILTENGTAVGVMLKNGETVYADKILSSAGVCETYELCRQKNGHNQGTMGFTEVIYLLKSPMAEKGYKNTILFYNSTDIFHYCRPEGLLNTDSGVVCCPDNFQNRESETPMLRVTNIASSPLWDSLEKEEYRRKKAYWLEEITKNAEKLVPLKRHDILFTDMFTPKTVKRYTGHYNGAVYGSPDKLKDGKTDIHNLFICGTDQGFLGIVGSMLSGVSMANLHCLQ